MYQCLQLIYMWCDWMNEWKPEKCHECTNMGKVKCFELWWQMYITSLQERDIQNFRPLDFCCIECTTEAKPFSSQFYIHSQVTEIRKCTYAGTPLIKSHSQSVTKSSKASFRNLWFNCTLEDEQSPQEDVSKSCTPSSKPYRIEWNCLYEHRIQFLGIRP